MNNFTITPIDAALVPLTNLICQQIKTRVTIPKRLVPLLPFAVAWLLTAGSIYVMDNGFTKLSVYIVKVLMEGFKVAVLAMAAYTLTTKTVKGA